MNLFSFRKTFVIFSTLFLFVGLSFASKLSVSPSNGSLGYNCIEGFDIVMDANGEKILGVDVEINSSMEYVDFVPNKELFEFFLPPRVVNGIIVLGAFSLPGNEATLDNVVVGKLYLKSVSKNKKSFIKFQFNGIGSTVDSNLSIGGGIDKLETILDGSYVMDGKECSHDATIEGGFGTGDYDSQMLQLTKNLDQKFKQQRIKDFLLNKNSLIGLSILVLVIILLIGFKKNKGYIVNKK